MDNVNLILLICSGLAVASVFTSVVAFRAGAPLLLFFLIVGVLAGRDGPGGVVFTDTHGAYLIGSAALAIILFDSGFHTSLKSYRLAALPAITLATFGVLITAAVVALPAWLWLDMSPVQALLTGTILSSTDAAALFFLLRVGGMTIRDRVRSTLEVESGTNDPMAILLTLTLVNLLAGGSSSGWELALHFIREVGLGVLLGLGGGAGIILVINRVRLEPGLYPVVTMGLAVTVFALTNLLDGSGFLATYLAGLVAGNAKLQSGGALRRFQDGFTWLAQIAMFVTLGLLASPRQFPAVLGPGLLLAVVLTLVARPVAVAACLFPWGYNRREVLFAAWVGLRGPVSILLALVPVVSGVPGGDPLFQMAFLVVVASLLVQGWTVRPLAKALRLIVPEQAGPAERVEVDLPGLADRELVTYVLHPGSAVARGRPLPRWARPILVRRDHVELPPTVDPQPGDHLYLLVSPTQIPLLDRLFGRGLDIVADEASLYGDFDIPPETTLQALRLMYGLDVPDQGDDDHITVADLFRRHFPYDLEPGDRLHLGPVDLIIRDMHDGTIEHVGLALDPPVPAPQADPPWKRTVKGWLGVS